MEAGESTIYRVGRQAGDPGRMAGRGLKASAGRIPFSFREVSLSSKAFN